MKIDFRLVVLILGFALINFSLGLQNWRGLLFDFAVGLVVLAVNDK